MFQMWGKLIQDNRLLNDHVARCGDYSLSRTDMVLRCLEELCYTFDLEKPIWLDANIREFQRISKTRFTKDSFIESIDFDYLEIQVIEE